MKNLLFVFILVLSGFIAARAQSIAFTNVNVIPMDKERVLSNQTVIVSRRNYRGNRQKCKNSDGRASD